MAVVSDEVLAEWLTSLRLPTIRDRLGSLLDEAARRELSLREVVVLLCERELSAKRDSRIRRNLGLARFPSVRELADFDHDAQPGVDAGQARLSVVEAPAPEPRTAPAPAGRARPDGYGAGDAGSSRAGRTTSRPRRWGP